MKNEKKRALFDAVTGIDEDLIDEAAAPKALPFPKRILRVATIAAVIAILMTALLWPKDKKPGEQMGVPTVGTTVAPTLPTEVPTIPEMPTLPTETQGYELVMMTNVVKLYSYDKENVSEEELQKYEITDGVSSNMPTWIERMNTYWGITLRFQVPQDYYGDAEITFRMVAPYGDYWGKCPETNEFAPLGKTVETGNPGYVAWKPGDDLEIMKETFAPGAFYAYVLIYADNRPVGFGLLEFSCRQATTMTYSVHLRRFRAVCYPLVDGQLQDVSEEYIGEQIAEYEQVLLKEYEDVMSKVDPTWKGRESDGNM